MGTIVTYGGGDILHNIFSAIAMLLHGDGSNSLRPLLVIGASIGGVWAVTKALFSQHADWVVKQWFLPVLIIGGVLMVPTSKVRIEDVLSRTSREVSGVPWIVARFAEMASSIGYKVTSAFESVMHTPRDTNYNATGMLFGSDAALDFRRLKVSNADLDRNLKRFAHQCVFYDLALGKYSLDEIRKTKDLWGFLEANTSKVRMMPYSPVQSGQTRDGDSSGKPSNGTTPALLTCQGALKEMKPHFEHEKEYFAKQEITKNLPLTFQALTKIQDSKEELISQQLMMNLLSGELDGGKLAAIRAATQQRNTYHALGAIAGKSLLTIRIVIEALIYASFVLVIPLTLLPGGLKFLMTWMGTALWIQLWPPFYAILSYIMQTVAQSKTAAIFCGLTEAQQGLSFFTNAGLQNLNEDIFALAGYLSASIPFLSYAILKGGVGSFIHLAGSMMTPAHTAAGAAAAEQSTGNYSFANASMGNLSYGNTTGLQRNLAPSLSGGYFAENRGTSSVVHGQGEAILKQANSELRTSVFGDRTASESAQIAHQQAASMVEQSQQQSVESLSSHGREFSEYAQHLAHSESLSDSFSQREGYDLQESARYVESIAANWGEQYGLSRRESMELMSSAGAGGSVGLNLGVVSAKMDGDLKRWSSHDQATRDDIVNSALTLGRSEDFQRHYQSVLGSTTSDTHSLLDDEGQRLASSVSHSMDQVTSSQESYQSSQSALEQFSSAVSSTDAHSVQVRQALNQDFINWASESHADRGGFGWVADTITRGSASEKQALMGEFVDHVRAEQGSLLSPKETAYIRDQATSLPESETSWVELGDMELQTQSLLDRAHGGGLNAGYTREQGQSLRAKSAQLQDQYGRASEATRETLDSEDDRVSKRLAERQGQGKWTSLRKNPEPYALVGKWRVSEPPGWVEDIDA